MKREEKARICHQCAPKCEAINSLGIRHLINPQAICILGLWTDGQRSTANEHELEMARTGHITGCCDPPPKRPT